MSTHKNIKDAMKAAKLTKKPQKVSAQTLGETKINVSIRLDEDVLTWLKAEADRQALPYTTLANSLLKRASQNEPVEERVARLERLILDGKVG